MSSWVHCPCGKRIGIGAFPNPNTYRIVSEERYDQVEDPLDRKKIGALFLSGGLLVQCPNCQRILIQWTGDSGFESFVGDPKREDEDRG